MRKKIKYIFFILIFLNILKEGNTYANEDSIRSLSLNECIDMAKSSNKQYLNSKFEQEAKKSFLEREHSPLHPKLNFDISGSKQAYLGEPIAPTDAFQNLRNVLTVSQTLFPNRNIKKSLIEASLDYDTSVIHSNLRLAEAIFLVKQNYWRLVALFKIQSLKKQRLNYLDKICKIKEYRESIGLASRLEIKSAYIQKKVEESDILKINNEITSDMVIFKNLIGIRLSEEVKLSDPLPKLDDQCNLESVHLESFDMDNLLPIKIAGNDILRDKARIKYAKKSYWPHIQFTIGRNDSFGNFYSTAFDNNWNLSLSSSNPYQQQKFSTTETNFVGFSVSFDIFDGGYADKSVKYEKNNLESSRVQFELLKDELMSKIIQDINNTKDLEHTLEIIVDNKEIGYKNIELAELKHNSGEYSLEKVIEAKLDYADIERKYVETLYELNLAIEQLKFDLHGDVNTSL